MREHESDSPGASSLDAACTRCGICRERCAFLAKYGLPGDVAAVPGEIDPFECSLCGLCDAVCPEGLRPSVFFLDMRRLRVETEVVDLTPYAPLLFFEGRGDSSLFSLLRLPKGGDTVLFPGCAMPTTRPGTVLKVFEALKGIEPKLGVALGCCLKPSHDLGRQGFFEERFGRLLARLERAGVRRVVTMCPNCFKVFREYAPNMRLTTVYELLAENGVAPVRLASGEMTVHDPCPARNEAGMQDAVRELAGRCGVRISEMESCRAMTICCGEGGTVGLHAPGLAARWVGLRKKEAAGRTVVTSCAGCSGYLGRAMETRHILDLFFDSATCVPLPQPLPYLVRLLLKLRFALTVR